MIKQINKRVTYFEQPIFEVANALRKLGYAVANVENQDRIAAEPNFLDLYKKVHTDLIYLQSESLKVGTLYFGNEQRKANSDSYWILEVNGRNNVSELIELMKKLSKEFKTTVEVRLAEEENLETVTQATS